MPSAPSCAASCATCHKVHAAHDPVRDRVLLPFASATDRRIGVASAEMPTDTPLLAGKRIIVTGASRGLGRAFATAAAALAVIVFIVLRNTWQQRRERSQRNHSGEQYKADR